MMNKIIEKPWGIEEFLFESDEFIVRKLKIRKGEAVSLHYHQTHFEVLYILKGKAQYTIKRVNEETLVREIGEGEFLIHRPHEVHREIALEDFEFLEISSPNLEDIVRIEDMYGR